MGKAGFRFSWRWLLGTDKTKRKVGRMFRVPLTRSGRQRKAGRWMR